MAGYMNPEAMFPQAGINPMIDPMAVGLKGLQTAYGVGQMNQDVRDQDLKFLEEQNLYNNKMLDNPNIAAQRALLGSQLGRQQNVENSGLPQQVDIGALQTTLGQQQATQSQSRAVQRIEQGEFFKNVSDELKGGTQAGGEGKGMGSMLLSANSPGGWWDQKKALAKEYGIHDIPDKLTPDNIDSIYSHADTYMNNRDFLHQQALESMKTGSAEKVANIHAGASKEVATIGADAGIKRAVIAAQIARTADEYNVKSWVRDINAGKDIPDTVIQSMAIKAVQEEQKVNLSLLNPTIAQEAIQKKIVEYKQQVDMAKAAKAAGTPLDPETLTPMGGKKQTSTESITAPKEYASEAEVVKANPPDGTIVVIGGKKYKWTHQ